jgi:hypothetical protein
MSESTRRWSAACLGAVLAIALSACRGSVVGSPGSTAPNVMPPIATSDGMMSPDAVGPVNIYPGAVIGTDNLFRPGDGDTTKGGQGATMANIPCDKREHTGQYHIHAYLGLIVNGKQVAVPDVIGMVKPGTENNGFTSTAGCFYWIHTHDASGMIHIEVPKAYGLTTSHYKLGAFLAIWGMSHTSSSFGPFKGPVHVYVGNVTNPGHQTVVSKYKAYANSMGTIPLRTHTAVWVEVGATQTPPSVTFYTQW